jgi:hypothetical protein
LRQRVRATSREFETRKTKLLTLGGISGQLHVDRLSPQHRGVRSHLGGWRSDINYNAMLAAKQGKQPTH